MSMLLEDWRLMTVPFSKCTLSRPHHRLALSNAIQVIDSANVNVVRVRARQ